MKFSKHYTQKLDENCQKLFFVKNLQNLVSFMYFKFLNKILSTMNSVVDQFLIFHSTPSPGVFLFENVDFQHKKLKTVFLMVWIHKSPQTHIDVKQSHTRPVSTHTSKSVQLVILYLELSELNFFTMRQIFCVQNYQDFELKYRHLGPKKTRMTKKDLEKVLNEI